MLTFLLSIVLSLLSLHCFTPRLHSTVQKATVPSTSKTTAIRSCQYNPRYGEYQNAMEVDRHCMNLKMAKAEAELSLNVPPRIENI